MAAQQAWGDSDRPTAILTKGEMGDIRKVKTLGPGDTRMRKLGENDTKGI